MEPPAQTPQTASRLRPLLGRGSLALWAVAVLLWLLDITGADIPVALARAVVLAAASAGITWIAMVLGRARGTALLLPALLVLSLGMRFVGIDHEAEGRYYEDEGTYYHHATKINEGEVLRVTFVYPHLTYYADAFVLWLAALFPGAVPRLVAALYGVEEPLAVSWVLLRGVVALLSALTVVPVFRIAQRLHSPQRTAGAVAGAMASLLLIFSPLYNEGSHLNTSDVPSAFFATLCLLFVARLVDAERTRDYLLAGMAAGLAAASKYPAGVVAVAIVAVWLLWRLRRRDWSFGLLWAGLVSLATFVAVMPSLLYFPEQALFGGRGIFFGARQYSQGGWLGVMPSSNSLYYLEQLAWSFGVPALLIGLTGLVILGRRDREALRRLLWLLPYPAAYLLLIASMNMVVRRNLYPALPILAVLLGAGIGAWGARLARRQAPREQDEGKRGRWLLEAGILLLLAVAPAAARTLQQEVALARPSTREVAAAWIREHVPHGATLVKESYTPDFGWWEYQVVQRRFAGRFSMAELRDPAHDYLLVASAAYGRFEQPERFLKPHHREFARLYQQVFATFPLVRRWEREQYREGPELRLYRIPDPPGCGPPADLPAAGAFVPDGSMRPRPKRPIEYTVDGQWSAFKGCFDAGTWRVTVRGEPTGPGELEVASVDGQKLGRAPLDAGMGREVRLPRRGKYLFYVYLPVGSRVRGVTVERVERPAP